MRETITEYLFHEKGPLTNFWTIVLLVVAIAITFLATQSHYEDKLNTQAQASLKSDSLMTEDFTSIIKQTKGKIDCSDIQDGANLTFCNATNATRQ